MMNTTKAVKPLRIEKIPKWLNTYGIAKYTIVPLGMVIGYLYGYALLTGVVLMFILTSTTDIYTTDKLFKDMTSLKKLEPGVRVVKEMNPMYARLNNDTAFIIYLSTLKLRHSSTKEFRIIQHPLVIYTSLSI